jgi:hypothetical protein
MSLRVGRALTVAVVLAGAQRGRAQEDAPATTLTVSTTDIYRFESDLEDVPGDVAVTQAKVSIELAHRSGMTDFWRFSSSLEYDHYDFSNGAMLVPGVEDLFDDMYVARAEGSYVHAFGAEWSGLGYAALSTAFEGDASIGEGVAIGLGAGPIYRADDDLTLGLILRYQSRIEDEPYVFPVPYIEWKISSDVVLRTEQKAGYGLALSGGFGAEKRLGWEARMYYTARRFRLDESGALPDGVVEDARFPIDLGLRYSPVRDASIALHAGADVWQEYWIDDRHGDGLEDVESEVTPFVALVASWAF